MSLTYTGMLETPGGHPNSGARALAALAAVEPVVRVERRLGGAVQVGRLNLIFRRPVVLLIGI